MLLFFDDTFSHKCSLEITICSLAAGGSLAGINHSAVTVGIIADDLTSATDVGAQFAGVGYDVQIEFNRSRTGATGRTVLAIDADSRTRSLGEAVRRQSKAARRLRNVDILYKSIDSTLRGHIGEELHAVMQTTKRGSAIVAPAFPSAGRTTRSGVQFLNDVRISETSFARDQQNPVRESCIATLLERAGLGPIAVLRRGEARNRLRVRRALTSARCIIGDAESDEDLRLIVNAVDRPSDVCWVGSPGLARVLGEKYPSSRRPRGQKSRCRGIIVVVGSLHDASRRQLAYLLSAGKRKESVTRCDIAQRRNIEVKEVGELFPNIQEPARVFVVYSKIELRPRSNSRLMARRIGTEIAEAASRFVNSGLVDGIVVTGGDTAGILLHRLSVGAFQLDGELEPGIPIGHLVGGQPLRIITKAGGFGDDDVFFQACRALSDLPSVRDGR